MAESRNLEVDLTMLLWVSFYRFSVPIIFLFLGITLFLHGYSAACYSPWRAGPDTATLSIAPVPTADAALCCREEM